MHHKPMFSKARAFKQRRDATRVMVGMYEDRGHKTVINFPDAGDEYSTKEARRRPRSNLQGKGQDLSRQAGGNPDTVHSDKFSLKVTRSGWKGWVPLEGPMPQPKTPINLDEPLIYPGRLTRSGRSFDPLAVQRSMTSV